LPPAFAARLRAVLLPLDDDLLVPDDLRAVDVERRLEELEDDELELRLRPPDALAVDLRAPPEELDDLRAPDALGLRELEDDEPLDLRALDPRALDPRALDPPEPDDFRADPPPDDDFLRDEPPPLPELDSAIALPPLKLRTAYPLGAGGTICPPPR
jgi:hypothetical protein